MIFFAVAAPTAGSASSSFSDAVLRSNLAPEGAEAGATFACAIPFMTFSSAGFAAFSSFAAFTAGFSVFAVSAAGADPRPAFTSGLIFAIVSAETPARDRSDTEEKGLPAMIFFAVAAPTPGRLSRSAWLALLMSILSAFAASAGAGDIARPQARIAARTRAPFVAVRIVGLLARGAGFRLRRSLGDRQPRDSIGPREPGSGFISLGRRPQSECRGRRSDTTHPFFSSLLGGDGLRAGLAPRRGERNDLLALRALLRGRLRLARLRDEGLRDHVDHEGDDDEVHERPDQVPVGDRRLRRLARRVHAVGQDDFRVSPVAPGQQQPDDRVDRVLDDRGNDFSDSGADDDADRQGEGVLLEQEFLELFDHEGLLLDVDS